GERDHHDRLRLRQRHQAELGFQHYAQGSFGADHDLGQVYGPSLVGEFVQVVAAYAAENFGIAAVDFGGVLGGQAQARVVAGGFERVCFGQAISLPHIAEVGDAAVRQGDDLFQHVVDGLAVQDTASAARVVGHHAADGGAAGCGDIGGESQTERSELRLQLVQHHSSL